MENGNTIWFELGKIASDGHDIYQSIRIAQNSRVRDIVRKKIEGIPLDQPEEKKEVKKYDKKFKDENILKFLDELISEGKITDEEKQYIWKLLDIAKETSKTEKKYKDLMGQSLKKEEIWYGWLEKVKGISSILGSTLVKNFGYCETYPHISSLWRHCGQDPEGAKGRQKGKKIFYDPKLKPFIWKIGDSFIKQRTQPYRGIYDREKARQLSLMENKAELAPKSLLHADRRARRKMVKTFLQHYWKIGRQFKKLPISKPYAFDKLGHSHYIEPPFNPFKDGDAVE